MFICLSSFLVLFTFLNSFLVSLFIFLNRFMIFHWLFTEVAFQFCSFVLCFNLLSFMASFSSQVSKKDKDHYQVVRKCLGLIFSLWDDELRKGPSNNPKNTTFGSRMGYGVRCLMQLFFHPHQFSLLFSFETTSSTFLLHLFLAIRSLTNLPNHCLLHF